MSLCPAGAGLASVFNAAQSLSQFVISFSCNVLFVLDIRKKKQSSHFFPFFFFYDKSTCFNGFFFFIYCDYNFQLEFPFIEALGLVVCTYSEINSFSLLHLLCVCILLLFNLLSISFNLSI